MPRLPPKIEPFSIFGGVIPDEPVENAEPKPKPPSQPTSVNADRLRRLLGEYASRQAEALKIYRPLPNGEAFHKSQAKERLVVGSNRAGKSQCCGAEMAWWLMGCHPWRKVPKEKAHFVAVGWDWDHVGRVMWPKLGQEGSFKMIRDEFTRDWRPVVPDNQYDSAYEEKWKDAPPFLPPRFIKRIAWMDKKTSTPSYVYCANNSWIQFCSSNGEPKQGDAIHGWWADEELEHARWISELERGCTSTRGGGFYSATPLAQSVQLYEMHRRALDPKNFSSIQEFRLSISDNIYISKEAKDEFYGQLLSPMEIMVRWHGNFSMNMLTVYPEFNQDVHVIPAFEIPNDWSRYMVVDPGNQICAVLFAAVPPPRDKDGKPHPNADEVHIYDELYIERCTASIFGEQVARAMGHRKRGEFEAFIIDHRMGRQTETGSGRTVESQYSEELQSRGIWSDRTGSGFAAGSDDVRSREDSLRHWMMKHPKTGKPTLQIHGQRCKKLVWELPQQFFKRNKEGHTSDKRRDVHDHATTALEYLADFAPEWYPPRRRKLTGSPAWERIQAKKRKTSFNGESVISLGPKG